MNVIELKEMLSAVIKKNGAHSSYEVTYGATTKPTFLHRKQFKWVATDNTYNDSEVDNNYLICVPNINTFITHSANYSAMLLTVVRADPEVWIDGVKYKEGNTLAEVLSKTDLTTVAYVSENYNYRIEPSVLEMVKSWEKGELK